jgi:cytochrome c551/c552
MKKLITISVIAIVLYACGGEPKKEESKDGNVSIKEMMEDSSKPVAYEKGLGKFTNVDVPPNLDAKSAALGNGIYDLKCSACHKLTAEKLVGPGWKGVTDRRKAEWIMNFVTNTEEMIDKDPEAQAMLEVCMVRMPNQSLSDDDARHVYEYMRKNDGVK